MPETITLLHTYEVTATHEGVTFALASYDARLTVEVIDDGADWTAEVELLGCAWAGKRMEQWFPASPPMAEDIRRSARATIEAEIAAQLCSGDIGPHMRAASAAERRREMAGA